jgi:hypothetical protein
MVNYVHYRVLVEESLKKKKQARKRLKRAEGKRKNSSKERRLHLGLTEIWSLPLINQSKKTQAKQATPILTQKQFRLHLIWKP